MTGNGGSVLAALDAHFRWVILQRYGNVHSISDPEMLADILTKCVSSAKFAKTSVESDYVLHPAENQSCFLQLEVHINFVRVFLKLLLPQQRVEPVPSLHWFLNFKETPFPSLNCRCFNLPY